MADPKPGVPAHVTDFGTVSDNLTDALRVYEGDKGEFFATSIDDPKLIEVCRRWNQSMKELIQCAEGCIRITDAGDEARRKALELMDYATKDCDRRKKTMLRYADWVLSRNPNDEGVRLRIRNLTLEQIHITQAAMNSQSLYIRYVRENKSFADQEYLDMVDSSRRAAHVRECVPEGHHFRPAFIYPKKRIPPGERVPEWPDAYERVGNLPPEEKVFDPELCDFVLPEGYLSEDGLIDDKSVVWHPETHEVEIGYRGGVRTVWDYKRFIDPREVWIPGEWGAEYLIRLYEQQRQDRYQIGMFLHKAEADEVPDYDRIPHEFDNDE